jgi:hypothetical protein
MSTNKRFINGTGAPVADDTDIMNSVMSDHRPSPREVRPAAERPPFERIALILSGGGALGSYQAGVYQALAERNLHPDWVAGISIGAVNAALIAGNPPERRVDRLRAFWETVSGPPSGARYFAGLKIRDSFRRIVNHGRSFDSLLAGVPGFYKLRMPPPYLQRNSGLESLSYYDVAPLKSTLERLVDFDLINAGATRFSACAVNVRTGNVARFDSTTCQICPEQDRRRLLLGRRSRLQYAAAMGAGHAAEKGHARLPSGSMERPRRHSTQFCRERGAREGHPLLQPHPVGDGPVQEGADAPPRNREAARQDA